jgi:hypothetical protein
MPALKWPASVGTEAARSSGNGQNPEAHGNYSTDKYQAAIYWLRMGARLIPCQHGSKFILAGFGSARKTIGRYEQAERYFGIDGYNLAVLLPAGIFCLDFDDPGLFRDWSDRTPVDLQLTRTETTPRGGWHLFYRGDVPFGARLITGVEIKRVVLVCPSQVAGIFYRVIEPPDPILEIPDTNALFFSLLSEEIHIPEREPSSRIRHDGDGLIDRIKRNYSVLLLASSFTELKPSPPGQRRWYLGRCPLHDDHNPSFWVDAERDVWSCFSPNCQGHTGDGPGEARAHDVVNLYAFINKISNDEAIRRMAWGIGP